MGLSRTAAVGITIPVHNEESRLALALEALERSASHVRGRDLEIHVAVVLDACNDASAAITDSWRRRFSPSRNFNIAILSCHHTNVGQARALGLAHVLERVRHVAPSRVWLATTDGDSRVPAQWLDVQIAKHDDGFDLWAGRVAVDAWPSYRRTIALAWQRNYDEERYPIHGASLGMNAVLYTSVGGFPPLRSGEDRALYHRLVAQGAMAFHDSSAPVITSARRHARAPGGFASALSRLKEPRRGFSAPIPQPSGEARA